MIFSFSYRKLAFWTLEDSETPGLVSLDAAKVRKLDFLETDILNDMFTNDFEIFRIEEVEYSSDRVEDDP